MSGGSRAMMMWKQQRVIKPPERRQLYDTEKDFGKSDPEHPHEFSPQDALDLYEDAVDAITNQLPVLELGARVYISRLPFFTRMKWKMLGWKPDGLRRALECRGEFQKMADDVRRLMRVKKPKLEKVSMDDGVYLGALSWIKDDPKRVMGQYR